jgi:hypothetical protein
VSAKRGEPLRKIRDIAQGLSQYGRREIIAYDVQGSADRFVTVKRLLGRDYFTQPVSPPLVTATRTMRRESIRPKLVFERFVERQTNVRSSTLSITSRSGTAATVSFKTSDRVCMDAEDTKSTFEYARRFAASVALLTLCSTCCK